MASFIRGLLDDEQDPQLPQYDPEGGWNTAKGIFDTAASMTTPGALADAAGYLGSPSAVENVKAGNYGDAALQALGMIPGAGLLGKAGLGAKMALIAGPMAKTADKAALAQAEKMHGSGADRKAIWDATGWFKGADDKWRFEIPDDQSKLSPMTEAKLTRSYDAGSDQSKLAGALWHDKAYAAYPDLRKATSEITHTPWMGNAGIEGVMLRDQKGDPVFKMTTNTLDGQYGPRSILLHEMQHAIQDTEDFARGANPNAMREYTKEGQAAQKDWLDFKLKDEQRVLDDPNARDSYKTLAKKQIEAISKELAALNSKPVFDTARDAYAATAGEIEARNVQKRMNMTPEERKATPPWETEEKFPVQIVRGLLGR